MAAGLVEAAGGVADVVQGGVGVADILEAGVGGIDVAVDVPACVHTGLIAEHGGVVVEVEGAAVGVHALDDRALVVLDDVAKPPVLLPPTDTAPSPAAVVLSPRVKSPVSTPTLNASSMLIVELPFVSVVKFPVAACLTN